jgi:RHS repeat-associated protein
MSAARAILAALAGLLLCAAAQAQELNTAFVSQSVPPLMTAGQSYPVSVTLKNTGTWGWGTTSGHFLGSQNPQNNTTWGLNRVALPHFVGPTQNVTFSFQVTAPATAGTYNFQWRMVNPATYGWFGATTPNVSVQVMVADAAFVSQSVPSTMVAGQSASVSVTLQNTGGTTWAAGSTALGSQNPQDNSTWGLNRVALPAPVAPGASATINFSIAAPSTPGTYNFQWRMLEGTSGWFGAPSTNVAVNVISGTPDANVFFIQVDHLNTPRLVANAAGTTVWRWNQQEPFGVTPPDENPSSLGAFEFPLRFPGQYADKETNLYYNYFRDYDSSTGRYIQPDPLGIAITRLGAAPLHHIFGYANQNSLTFVDPNGETALVAPAAGVGTIIGGPIGGLIGAGIGLGLSYLIYDACTTKKAQTVDCEKARPFHLAAAGITDEHKFKTEWGAVPNSRFDICACQDGSIVIKAAGQCGQSGAGIPTDSRWK